MRNKRKMTSSRVSKIIDVTGERNGGRGNKSVGSKSKGMLIYRVYDTQGCNTRNGADVNGGEVATLIRQCTTKIFGTGNGRSSTRSRGMCVRLAYPEYI